MAVRRTGIYNVLKERIDDGENLIFIDYDATNISLGCNHVLNDTMHKIGYAAVLAAMLLGEYNPT